MTKEELCKTANDMRKMAYIPYSGYSVGAALLTDDGRVFTGCNIENSAYSMTNCAERTAFFKAVSEGVYGFKAIAIAAGPKDKPSEGGAPCGACRQVMVEFCKKDFMIYLLKGDDIQAYTLEEILPHCFSPADIS